MKYYTNIHGKNRLFCLVTMAALLWNINCSNSSTNNDTPSFSSSIFLMTGTTAFTTVIAPPTRIRGSSRSYSRSTTARTRSSISTSTQTTITFRPDILWDKYNSKPTQLSAAPAVLTESGIWTTATTTTMNTAMGNDGGGMITTIDPTTFLQNLFSAVLGTPLILAVPIVAALSVATLLAYLIVSYANPAVEEDE